MAVLKEIRAKVKEDKAFSDSLKRAKRAEEVLEVLLSAGFEMTIDEVKAMAETDEVELSDEALGSVSGGTLRPTRVQWPFW